VATRAYILIETAVGKTRDVVKALSKVKGMQSVDAVTGPYDVIAVAEGSTLNALGDLVTSQVHTVPGITRTVTCLSVATGTIREAPRPSRGR
jgi:DNA-binding Lrp family transcriptional regulator